MKKYLLLLFTFYSILITQYSFSQVGGTSTYKFLDLPVSARQASLGGNVISVKDNDINLAYLNPAIIDSGIQNHLSLSYINYFSDINFGYTGYAFKQKNLGTLVAGLQYISYGKFTRADETGLTTGNFSAGEYAFHLSGARPVKDSLFTIGSNLKLIYSSLDQNNSFGAAADITGFYFNKDKKIGVGAVIKNIGAQVTTYRKGNREPLPFEAQLGISKQLEKAPLRLSMVYENIQKFKLAYVDTTNTSDNFNPLTGEMDNKKQVNFGHQLLSHLVIGAELYPMKNFFVRLGYNHHRRQNLRVESRPGTAGFSWGFGMRINRFHLSYGRAVYHLAGPSNHFTISTSLSSKL